MDGNDARFVSTFSTRMMLPAASRQVGMPLSFSVRFFRPAEISHCRKHRAGCVHDVLHRLKMTRITKMMKKKKLLLLMMIIVYCLYLLIHLHHVGLMYLYLDIYLSSILTVQYVISYKHMAVSQNVLVLNRYSWISRSIPRSIPY